MVFAAAPIPLVSTMSPAAGLTLFTRPPTPRFCQSSRSCSCFLTRSACLTATICKACGGGPGEAGSSLTSTRSPVSRSLNWRVSALLRSFCPGEMRLIAVVEGTSNWRTSPASVFTVTVVPPMAVMVPTKREGDGVCARRKGAARRNAAKLTKNDLRMIEAGTNVFILLIISHFSTDKTFPLAGAME